MWSMVSPAATGTDAQATCPTSFTTGDRPMVSSTTPNAAISTPPAMSPRTAGSAGRNQMAGSRKPSTMAMESTKDSDCRLPSGERQSRS